MKIIEGLKQTKRLQEKASDLRAKIKQYCADLSYETPTYGTPDQQRDKITEWLQSHGDVLKEIERIRLCVARTNLATNVTIELDGKQVTKPITSWIARRKELAGLELAAWQQLGDRGLREGQTKSSSGADVPVTIRRYFDASARDQRIAALRDEPSLIDAALEITNAVVDLIEK